MTHNQSELAANLYRILNDYGCFDDADYDSHEAPMLHELTAYITANYTPNTQVELLKSRIAWLEGKLEGLSEMIELTKDKEQL